MLGRLKKARPSIPDSSAERVLSQFLQKPGEAPWRDALPIFWNAIASSVIKVLGRYGHADPDEVDDLIQDVHLRLCADDFRLLRQTRAERPAQLFAYVQAVATTTALDRYRSESAQRRGADANVIPLDVSVSADDGNLISETLNREMLISEVDRHLQKQPSRDRQIFWLYYRHGFTTKEIAAIPGLQLTAKGVESAIYRLTSEIRRIFSEEVSNAKGNKS
jgi:RNA polymerase sigma-70 factor (ECF subfamily)